MQHGQQFLQIHWFAHNRQPQQHTLFKSREAGKLLPAPRSKRSLGGRSPGFAPYARVFKRFEGCSPFSQGKTASPTTSPRTTRSLLTTNPSQSRHTS